MKDSDISKNVMKQVARYEKTRVSRWFTVFAGILLLLVIIFSIAMGIAIHDMVEREVFEPLTLVFEDREIIAQYWRDVLDMFVIELPLGYIVTGGIVCVCIAGIVILTGRRRAMFRKKLKTLEKYS